MAVSPRDSQGPFDEDLRQGFRVLQRLSSPFNLTWQSPNFYHLPSKRLLFPMPNCSQACSAIFKSWIIGGGENYSPCSWAEGLSLYQAKWRQTKPSDLKHLVHSDPRTSFLPDLKVPLIVVLFQIKIVFSLFNNFFFGFLKSALLCTHISISGLPWWLRGKESACNARDLGPSLDWEDPLEKGTATHSNILAWRISWTEDPGGLQSMGSQRVSPTEWLSPSPSSSVYVYLYSLKN